MWSWHTVWLLVPVKSVAAAEQLEAEECSLWLTMETCSSAHWSIWSLENQESERLGKTDPWLPVLFQELHSSIKSVLIFKVRLEVDYIASSTDKAKQNPSLKELAHCQCPVSG